jgi:hypothetical protein
MKPYITDAKVDGKYILPYQFEGACIGYENVESRFRGVCIVGYSLPRSQSLGCAWELRLYLSNGMFIDFSSAFTNVGGWQEVGSLNMRFTADATSESVLNNETYAHVEIAHFCINDLQSLVFLDDDVFSECGIVFIDEKGSEVIVAAGVSPGSVSALIPLSESDFNPEMGHGAYLKIKMRELEAYKHDKRDTLPD